MLDLLFSYLIFNVHCLSAWWAQVDSNHRPCAYQAHALTTWAMSPYTLSGFTGSLLYLFPVFAVAFRLVEMTGLEPVNPLLAKQVLSQLSYTPMSPSRFPKKPWKLNNEFSFLPLSRFTFHLFVLFQNLCASFDCTLSWFFLTKFEFESTSSDLTHVSLERRWSSHTFRYGYLVTT